MSHYCPRHLELMPVGILFNFCNDTQGLTFGTVLVLMWKSCYRWGQNSLFTAPFEPFLQIVLIPEICSCCSHSTEWSLLSPCDADAAPSTLKYATETSLDKMTSNFTYRIYVEFEAAWKSLKSDTRQKVISWYLTITGIKNIWLIFD